jgi:hypothetical protein
MLYIDQFHTFARAHQANLLREAETDRLINSLPADARSQFRLRARLAFRLHQLAYRLEPGIDPIAFLAALSVSARQGAVLAKGRTGIEEGHTAPTLVGPQPASSH